MNWYIAKLVFRIESGRKSGMPQFDEQLRLISASDHYEALQKAKALGMDEDESMLNDACSVKWNFIAVSELQEVQLKNGEELFSRIQEAEEGDHYIQYVRQKALHLEAGMLSSSHKNAMAGQVRIDPLLKTMN